MHLPIVNDTAGRAVSRDMQVKVANLVDRSVRYLDAGSGRGVMLLHAFPLSADQWLPQVHRMPRGWRAVAPDLRGFRGSRSVLSYIGPEPVTMDTYAADVFALMAHLDLSRVVVVGLSMGGYVAFEMARRAPDRIAGLVLANTRADADSEDGRTNRDRLIALAEREGTAGLAREMLPKLLGPTTRREQPDLEDAVRGLIDANDTDAVVSALRAMKTRPDSRPLLRGIECPTLIVSGEEDLLIPAAEADAMRRAIPQAAHVALPRAGHLTNLEAPAAFSGALAGFLDAVAAPPEKAI